MNKRTQRRTLILLLVVAALTIISAIIQYSLVSYSNNQEHTSNGLAMDKEVYADIHFRGDSTSSWLKQEIGLTGIIYDASIYNISSRTVNEWTLTINITGDCYINQFWNGRVEIHQFVGTDKEAVQTLDLANYDLDKIELEYIMDGSDLLIPLQKGDYVTYLPNAKFKEQPLASTDSAVVGTIFYYVDELDLSDYTLTYKYHSKLTEGPGFALTALLLLIWTYLLLMSVVAQHIYRKTERENKLRASGISCLTELYKIVYIVNLTDNTITPVGVNEEDDKLRPKNLTAQEQFDNIFSIDPKEEYRELALEFANLTALPDKLSERNSIAFEFESTAYGWCRLQFIAMERAEGTPVNKVLFTTQIINEDKLELDRMMDQVEAARHESNAKSAFLANMSHEIRTPINTILGLDTMILRESNDVSVCNYARDIKNAGNMLLALINSILDFSKLEAGKMELLEVEYSLKKMVFEIESIVKTRITSKNLAFKIEVSEDLPNLLYGDDVRLKQIIINLLTNALKYTDEGGIRLGIFGKKLDDDTVHLLISVKDSGSGITPENQKKLFERFSRFDENKNRNVEGTGIGMNLVQGLLSLMNSELRVASVYGQGSDFYFEIEQKILDPAPIGKVDWNNNELEVEEYEVSFRAPNANVLVVDDNDMNLLVFENLLKETEIQIDTASSGPMALDKTKECKYNIIFMDHMMPDMDGVEAMQKIKAQEDGKNNDTPIIVLTANAMQGAKENFMADGFTDFLAKPIDEDALEEKIVQNLPKELVEEGGKKVVKNTDDTPSSSLPEIEGVDISYALEHNGNKESLIRVLKQFVNTADSEAEELKRYEIALEADPNDSDALNSYRIKIHAMKTSAALCGALQLYGSAAALEFAAREGDITQITSTTGYFLAFWSKIEESFKSYFETKVKTITKEGSIKKATLGNLLDQLITSMNAYDIKASDAIIEELEKYKDDASLQQNLTELKTAVANLDAKQCEKLCQKLKG